jgi:hypothetical protein
MAAVAAVALHLVRVAMVAIPHPITLEQVEQAQEAARGPVGIMALLVAMDTYWWSITHEQICRIVKKQSARYLRRRSCPDAPKTIGYS